MNLESNSTTKVIRDSSEILRALMMVEKIDLKVQVASNPTIKWREYLDRRNLAVETG